MTHFVGLYPYHETSYIRQSIHAWKFQYIQEFESSIALSVAAFVNQFPWVFESVDILIPIPLHGRRYAERGFNQAAFLACCIAEHVSAPYTTRILKRTTQTKQQALLSKEERYTNMQQAFRVHGSVEGARVLLVDDVCTTGATLSAAAHVLQEAGAKEVRACTLGRGVI